MADQQESSPQAPEAQTPDSQPSQDNSDLSLPDHQAQGDDGDFEEAGSGDEIADAFEATKHLRPDFEEEESNGAEAPARESKAGQSESQAKEEGTPAPADTDRVKPSALASFHRQQKELFAAQQAFKAKEAEYARVMGVLENAKSDRLAALELMGYTDTKSFLESIAEDGGRETPERRQIRELTKWKADQEQARKQQEEQFQAQQHQQAVQAKVDAIRSEVQTTLKSELYKDSLLSLGGTDENVMAEMDRMATETGEMPRIQDAIKVVEAKYRSYLEEMTANPEVVKFFTEKLRSAKSASIGTPQSKTRARTQTIDSAARAPGTRVSSRPAALDDEDATFAEAMSFLKAQG